VGSRFLKRRSAILAALMVLCATAAFAEERMVPLELQLQLLSRVVRYERSYEAQATPARLVIVHRVGDAESARRSAQLRALLQDNPVLGARHLQVSAQEFSTAGALRGIVEHDGLSVVFLMPGLSDSMTEIAEALAGRNVITVSALGGDVDHGAVLGFELVSSKPRIAVNLSRARAQGLQFNAQLLRLVRVVR
jgi:hypothetical protein